MGHTRRQKPKRLPRKLLSIRKQLGLSQTEMAKRLKLRVSYTAVSGFERGSREPALPTLLAYARLVGVSTDLLIDDKLTLPWDR